MSHGARKAANLLLVLFLVIVALVSIAITLRTTPVVPARIFHRPHPRCRDRNAAASHRIANSSCQFNFVGTVNLIIPVAGVKPEQLIDTLTMRAPKGRVHDAIDITAAAETPVLAAADGKIVKLFRSERGGTTIYQLNANQDLIFYYAHLSRYADGLTEGDPVRQGQIIAYVSDTGNAGAGNYHLHFSIAAVSDPKRYWEGTNINPYPLLQNRAH